MSNQDCVRVPSYRLHKPTRQAVVTLDGRDIYLGKFGSAASRKEYRRLTGEWLASGGASPVAESSELTIVELLKRYRKFAERHYRPRPGSRTNELANMGHAVKPLREIYGHTLVKDFGPLALKALQQHLPHDRRSMFHRMRRTAASWYKSKGGDATELLGHSDPKTTRKYLDPRICASRSAADLLDDPTKGGDA